MDKYYGNEELNVVEVYGDLSMTGEGSGGR